MLALTATAPPVMIKNICHSLAMRSYKIVKASPNRSNVFLEVRERLPSNYGKLSYQEILKDVAKGLMEKRDDYPMTVIYMRVEHYCGYAFEYFNMLIENPYVGEVAVNSRLFAEFHASTSTRMREDILQEIKKENPRIRVIFATAALGMGVNAPAITQVIHIGPPSSMENYIQEVGRAGRNGNQSHAIIYYNKLDISEKMTTVEPVIKDYCRATLCYRQLILRYFDFPHHTQSKCCSNCNKETNQSVVPEPLSLTKRNVDSNKLALELSNLLTESEEVSDGSIIPQFVMSEEIVDTVLKNAEDVDSEFDLLEKCGVWDEELASKIYLILENCTL